MSATTVQPAADRLDHVERQQIINVLERCGWRIDGKGHAAERPSTLRSRMEKLGISRPPPDPSRP